MKCDDRDEDDGRSHSTGRRWGHSMERTAARHCRVRSGDEAEALSSESVYEVL